jgi:hypothetical protein
MLSDRKLIVFCYKLTAFISLKMEVAGSSVFVPEDGSSMFLRKIVLPDHHPEGFSLQRYCIPLNGNALRTRNL